MSAVQHREGTIEIIAGRPPLPGKRGNNPTLMVGLAMAVICAYCFTGHNAAQDRLKYYPPFRSGVDANSANTLGAEYYNIALALSKGRGFSDPFHSPTGPTAWMPPLLPIILAPLILATGNSIPWMMVIWLAAQVVSLTLCYGFVRRILPGRPEWLILGTFALLLTMQFRLSFQSVHDYGMLMLMLNGCLYWDARRNPLGGVGSATLWGVFGGLIVLASPVIGLVWAGLTLRRGFRRGVRLRMLLAGATATMMLCPWMIRNAIVFDRFIPLKSNLFYELAQSQFETADGVIDNSIFLTHPANVEDESGLRAEYVSKGEMAFLDARKEAFIAGLRADPGELLRRVGNRFLAAFVVYRPFNEELEPGVPGARWLFRLVHPLPFLACLVLVAGSPWWPLSRLQIGVVAAYLVCLAPYVLVSYYDRYAYPLLGLKVLLVVWGIELLVHRWKPISTEC